MPALAHGNLHIGKALIAYYGDRHVPCSGAFDEDAEVFRNDLTVTAVLKDANGDEVGGSAITLAIKSLSGPGREGIYEGTLSASTTDTLTENSPYFLEITSKDAGDTVLDFIRLEYVAGYCVGE